MDVKSYFLARYSGPDGVKHSLAFSRAAFNEESAEEYLRAQGVKNFMFYFDPWEPTELSDGTILMRGEIGWDITLEAILKYAQAGKTIILDSAGGSLPEGLRIYDGLRIEGGATIGVLGQAASAATLAVMGADDSFITENSDMTIHNPYTFTVGDAAETRAVADMLERETARLAAIYAEHSGRSEEDIRALMDATTGFGAQECVNMGFVKRVKLSKNESTKNQNKTDMKKKESGELKSLLDNFGNKLKNLLSGEVKALIVTDADGAELDFGEDVKSAEDIEVGLKGVQVDGANADGEYIMPDGETYVFSAGELTEIKPADDGGDNADAEAEIEDLRTKLVAAEAKAESVQAKLVAAEAKAESVQAKLVAAEAKAESVQKSFDTFRAELVSKFDIEDPTPSRSGAEGRVTNRVGRRAVSKTK